ncbi:MAG: S8 family serine peptidase [Clostridiales bacterium]|nr:S8 family serine peptidase [Clostridiales bacterium]
MEKISKGKKIFIAIVVIVTLIITIGGIMGFVKIGHDLGLEDQAIASEYDWYLERLFEDDNAVLAKLTKEATREFIDYMPEDFADVGAVSVKINSAEYDEYVQRKIQGLPVEKELNIDVEEYQRWLKITLNKKSKRNVIRAVEILSARSDVQFAEPYLVDGVASTFSNDAYASNQWGIENANIEKAWEAIRGGSTVLVGVLDTGIDASHPDLRDKIYYDKPLHRDFTTGEVNGKIIDIPTDPNGHGTHVAGIIGAECNNKIGVAGVADNVKFVSLRVFNDSGILEDVNSLINAIKYAEKNKIKLLNFSGRLRDNNPELEKVVEEFSGIIVVSAGNDKKDLDVDSESYPAVYGFTNVISVGAIDEQNEREQRSNWGYNTVDIFAPGSGIYSTFPTNICNENKCKYNNSIHIKNGYHSMSGTSMAAPFVTGTVAMMLSLEPNLTDNSQITDELKEDIKYCILKGADEIKIHNINGDELEVKKLNAYNALKKFTTYEINVLSETEIEITGTYGEKLTDYVELPQTIRGLSVTSIGYGAFENQDELTDIRLPKFLNNINPKAFSGCTNLRFYIEQGNSSFLTEGGILYSKDKTVIIAAGKISDEIEIGNPVEYILPYAFAGQPDLSSILFTTNANIGVCAFADCFKLANIVYTTHMPPSVWEDVFLNVQPKILVPYTALQAYKEAFSQYEDLIYSKSWTVNFISNDEYCGSMDVFYGEPIEDLPTPTLTGYDFFAWYDSPDFSGEAYTENDVRQAEENITLYAKYDPKKCTIKFDPGFGILLGARELRVDYGASFRTDITAEREGYVFEGWCDSDGFECITAFGASTIYWNRLEDTVLTPKWSKKSFEIKIRNSSMQVWVGKDGLSDSIVYIDYGEKMPGGSLKQLFENSPLSIKEGNIFNRLILLEETEINFSVVPDFGENKMQVLILPVWTREQYTIKFTAPNYEKEIKTFYKEYITLPNPETEVDIKGYYFGGWYLEETFVTRVAWETVPDLTPNVVGNGTVTLYGRWSPIMYYIEFDYNDGRKNTLPFIFCYDMERSLPYVTDNARENYVFMGWATSKNGEVTYINGAKVKNLTTINGATVTLYAVWQPGRYKIICKNLTEDMEVDFDYYIYGEGRSTMPKILSKNAYTYVYKLYGWYTSIDFKTKVTRISATQTGDITIYAKYDYFVCENTDYSSHRVTDDGVAKNPTQIIALYLKSVEYNIIKNTTLKKIKIEFSLYIEEINDGYQHIYLRDGYSSINIWSKKIDHPNNAGKSLYTYTIELNIEDYKDRDFLVLYFDASGAWDDDWEFSCFNYMVILTN